MNGDAATMRSAHRINNSRVKVTYNLSMTLGLGVCKCKNSLTVCDKHRNICAMFAGGNCTSNGCVTDSTCIQGKCTCGSHFSPNTDGYCYLKKPTPEYEVTQPKLDCSARGPFRQCDSRRGLIFDQHKCKCKHEKHQYFQEPLCKLHWRSI